jgi:putative PIN family toxin of toxin-antitoxin system
MKPLVVIDTNIWIRILLKGRVTLPVLEAFNEDKFQLIMSQPLMEELHLVWNRPRLKERINSTQAMLLDFGQNRGSKGMSPM